MAADPSRSVPCPVPARTRLLSTLWAAIRRLFGFGPGREESASTGEPAATIRQKRKRSAFQGQSAGEAPGSSPQACGDVPEWYLSRNPGIRDHLDRCLQDPGFAKTANLNRT